MSNHSNKKIVQHVDNSRELVEKMQKLTETLQAALITNFEKSMGCPLPNIIRAKVRETDVAMIYSSDPSVDEYVNGARQLLGAAFKGETFDLVNGMLDVVSVVASKIIGSGDLKVGIHSSAVNAGDYVTAVYAAIEKATAKDWATTADFFVSYYAFVVFNPSTSQKSLIERSPINLMVGTRSIVDIDEIKQLAAQNYAYSPL